MPLDVSGTNFDLHIRDGEWGQLQKCGVTVTAVKRMCDTGMRVSDYAPPVRKLTFGGDCLMSRNKVALKRKDTGFKYIVPGAGVTAVAVPDSQNRRWQVVSVHLSHDQQYRDALGTLLPESDQLRDIHGYLDGRPLCPDQDIQPHGTPKCKKARCNRRNDDCSATIRELLIPWVPPAGAQP